MRYKAWRSRQDHTTHLIVRDVGSSRDDGVDYFKRLPDRVRHLGPWVGSREGHVADLKTRYRLALLAEGFVLVHRQVTAFEPETVAHATARKLWG